MMVFLVFNIIAVPSILIAYSQSTTNETRADSSTVGDEVQSAELNNGTNLNGNSSYDKITGTGYRSSNNSNSNSNSPTPLQDAANLSADLHPFITPNPITSSEQAGIIVNYTSFAQPATSMHIDILGPNIGSTKPNLSPNSAGSQPLRLVSGSAQDGTWGASLEFPRNMSDGSYLFSLIVNSTGKVIRVGPFSSIVLDRNLPDLPQTKIISAVDTDSGAAIQDGGSTYATNITFKFQGSDRSGVILSFQCSLDDIIIASEHAEEDQDPSAFSTCYTPSKVKSQVIGYANYSDIAPGKHNFKVRAIDNEYDYNNTGSEFSWSVIPKANWRG
jgi:hypothetical protein